MRRMVDLVIRLSGLTVTLMCANAVAQEARMAQPPQVALPSIAPGENRSMSIQDLSNEAKPYFSHQQEQLKRVGTTRDGLTYRIVETSDSAVQILDRLAEKAQKSVDPNKLSAKTATLPDDVIADSAQVGVIAEKGASDLYTRVSWIYRTQDAKTVMVTEWDYLADGGGIVQFSEYVNATVRGVPAVLTVKRAGSKALWNLSWATSRKDFGIYMYESDFNAETAHSVMRLAERLSD